MKKCRIVIVDDSMFSVTMLSEVLTKEGFDVVGSANNLEQALEAVKTNKPDLVTMDMTMPGADGIEVTKAIHIMDPNVKVVAISSMMDDEIVRKAKKANIAGYIQKPVDAEDLALVINRIMADEELFKELEGIYYTTFKEAFCDTFNKFFKSVPTFDDESNKNSEQISHGISVVMGITGKYAGRIIFDTSSDTLTKIVVRLLSREPKNTQEMINILAEIANIAAGNACSMLNTKDKLFGLRVAPPTIVHGESLVISKSTLDTITSSKATTDFGDIYINVGFKRSEV